MVVPSLMLDGVCRNDGVRMLGLLLHFVFYQEQTTLVISWERQGELQVYTALSMDSFVGPSWHQKVATLIQAILSIAPFVAWLILDTAQSLAL
jgi:hypothetical protein